MVDVFRGDIYFVQSGGYTTGSEQRPPRPAVIVSNNKANSFAPAVLVVYLTTADKKPLPTHTQVLARVPSTALCEQVANVSKERLGEYVRTCTDEEMKRIDQCLKIALALDDLKSSTEESASQSTDIIFESLKEQIARKDAEIDKLKCECDALMETVQPAPVANFEDVLKLTVERDFYKEQYAMLLNKLIG